jgi:MFS transporter, AAHS family, 4-hydroxybenzoate transporter
VRRTLSRIAPNQIPANADLIASPEREREGIPVKHLFTDGRAVKTPLLWGAFFVCFMVLVTVTAWTPTVLRSVGFSLSAGALIIGLNNAGSVCASALSGFLIDRFGPFKRLVPGFAIGGLCLAAFGQATGWVTMLAVASTLAGFFVGGTGLLVGSGVGVEGVFYAAAIPCFLGALFVLLMKLAPDRTLQSPSLAPVVH